MFDGQQKWQNSNNTHIWGQKYKFIQVGNTDYCKRWSMTSPFFALLFKLQEQLSVRENVNSSISLILPKYGCCLSWKKKKTLAFFFLNTSKILQI